MNTHFDAGRQILLAAGWTPSRLVDIADLESSLLDRGYPVWPDLLAFAEQYNGLVTRLVHSHGAEGELVVEVGAAPVRKSFFDDLGRFVGSPVVPVAEIEDFDSMCVLTRDGRVLESHDFILMDGGNSLEEALGRVALEKGFPTGSVSLCLNIPPGDVPQFVGWRGHTGR